tara:strand:+ start:533 stop:718 length:186 start_codon:yes stop_codon:yes gene_type:complete
MTVKYKKVIDPMTDEVSCVRRWDDANDKVPTLLIPLDKNNTDYQEWQEWDAIDGNTTQDAD